MRTTFELSVLLHAGTPRAYTARVRAEVGRVGEHIIVYKVESLDWVVLTSKEYSEVYDEVVKHARLRSDLTDESMDRNTPVDPYLASYQMINGEASRGYLLTRGRR